MKSVENTKEKEYTSPSWIVISTPWRSSFPFSFTTALRPLTSSKTFGVPAATPPEEPESMVTVALGMLRNRVWIETRLTGRIGGDGETVKDEEKEATAMRKLSLTGARVC